jgi:hypothetical protein
MKLTCALAVLLVACGPAGRGADDSGNTGNPDGNPDGPPDASTGSDSGSIGVTSVYAHTADALYRVDPDTLAITKIGNFGWSNGGDQMTDLAIDNAGEMIGISYNSVYRVDPTTAVATRLSNRLTGGFNGLSFVPAAMLGQTGDDVLVGTRNSDGSVFRINPMTGDATAIGNMGGFTSSGDLVAVSGFTVLTADNGLSADRLVRLAPNTFAATPIGTSIQFSEIWGVAYWKDKIFGFTSGGDFITIDPNTGVGTLVQSGGPAWWGAAVTTSAPVILL